MTSPVPVKSQPLHNFNLPQLKWNKDGQSGGGQNQRRRTVKSPSRRPNSSSASPLRRSTSRDSISTAPFRDTTARDSPIRGDYLARQSPIRGESSKNSPIRECVKHSKKNSPISRNFQRRDSALESEALSKSTKDSRSSSFFPSHPEQAKNKPEKKLKAKEIDESKRSKILIKLPCKSSNKTEEDDPWPKLKKIENNIDNHNEIPEEKNSSNFDEDAKIWNLRPRKPLTKSKNVNGGAEKGKAPAMPEKNKSPQTNLIKSGEKEGNSGGGGEKKQKKKLSITIALTKQEIEEDIYALTGSKPARRPKKRPRNVQKQVDAAFPGLWLVSISPDSYKVSENSMKG